MSRGLFSIDSSSRPFADAIEYNHKGLIIRQKHFSPDHPDLRSTSHCVADIHLCLNYPDDALQGYGMTMKINQNDL